MTKKQSLESEYRRIRKNLGARIRRAKQAGRLPEPASLPAIPKKITEGSVRKLQKLLDKFFRGPKKRVEEPELPDTADEAAYNNFMSKIIEAEEWAGERFDWVNRAIRDDPTLAKEPKFSHWVGYVNRSGAHLHDAVDDALLSMKDENNLTYRQALHFFVKRIELLYRSYNDKFNQYLHGYADYDDPPKAQYFLMLMDVLNIKLTPYEMNAVMEAAFENIDENFEVYE